MFRTMHNAFICGNMEYLEFWNIQNLSKIAIQNSEPWRINNPGIFITLTYLQPDTYSEPSLRFQMEWFAKIVKSYN